MSRYTSSKREEIATAAGTKYACYFFHDPQGGYVVTSPGVPPLGAYGRTLGEARVNAREEIEEWEEEAERLRERYSAASYGQIL